MDKLPATHIATYDEKSITFRGYDLVNEIVGRRTFTQTLYYHTTGRWPDPGQDRVLDACLVILMEHGMTPSAIVTRLIADNVPDEPQAAIAAGLLAVGSVFVGTMEGCAALLQEGVLSGRPGPEYCRDVVARFRAEKRPVPGFGHPLHRPDDPRTPRLLEIARESGVPGRHIALLEALGAAVDAEFGRHLTINATGAIAALLLEIGIPLGAMRAMAVVSRSAGLVGHLVEERETGSGRKIWRLVDEATPYER